MAYKFDISKGEEVLLKAASIGAAVLAIVSVYSFYMNNIWKPKVDVKEVDFEKGIAKINVNGKPFVLRGDSPFLIKFDWGIKFGFTFRPDGRRVYDRIEILKRNMVQKVIRDIGEVKFTGFDEKTYWNDAFDGGKGGLVAVQRSFNANDNK